MDSEIRVGRILEALWCALRSEAKTSAPAVRARAATSVLRASCRSAQIGLAIVESGHPIDGRRGSWNARVQPRRLPARCVMTSTYRGDGPLRGTHVRTLRSMRSASQRPRVSSLILSETADAAGRPENRTGNGAGIRPTGD